MEFSTNRSKTGSTVKHGSPFYPSNENGLNNISNFKQFINDNKINFDQSRNTENIEHIIPPQSAPSSASYDSDTEGSSLNIDQVEMQDNVTFQNVFTIQCPGCDESIKPVFVPLPNQSQIGGGPSQNKDTNNLLSLLQLGSGYSKGSKTKRKKPVKRSQKKTKTKGKKKKVPPKKKSKKPKKSKTK